MSCVSRGSAGSPQAHRDYLDSSNAQGGLMAKKKTAARKKSKPTLNLKAKAARIIAKGRTKVKGRINTHKPNGASSESMEAAPEPSTLDLGPVVLPEPDDAVRVLKELAELNDRALAAHKGNNLLDTCGEGEDHPFACHPGRLWSLWDIMNSFDASVLSWLLLEISKYEGRATFGRLSGDVPVPPAHL